MTLLKYMRFSINICFCVKKKTFISVILIEICNFRKKSFIRKIQNKDTRATVTFRKNL